PYTTTRTATPRRTGQGPQRIRARQVLDSPRARPYPPIDHLAAQSRARNNRPPPQRVSPHAHSLREGSSTRQTPPPAQPAPTPASRATQTPPTRTQSPPRTPATADWPASRPDAAARPAAPTA